MRKSESSCGGEDGDQDKCGCVNKVVLHDVPVRYNRQSIVREVVEDHECRASPGGNAVSDSQDECDTDQSDSPGVEWVYPPRVCRECKPGVKLGECFRVEKKTACRPVRGHHQLQTVKKHKPSEQKAQGICDDFDTCVHEEILARVLIF